MPVRDRLLPYGPAYDNVVDFFDRDEGYSRTLYFRQKLLFGCQYYRRFWVRLFMVIATVLHSVTVQRNTVYGILLELTGRYYRLLLPVKYL